MVLLQTKLFLNDRNVYFLLPAVHPASRASVKLTRGRAKNRVKSFKSPQPKFLS